MLPCWMNQCLVLLLTPLVDLQQFQQFFRLICRIPQLCLVQITHEFQGMCDYPKLSVRFLSCHKAAVGFQELCLLNCDQVCSDRHLFPYEVALQYCSAEHMIKVSSLYPCIDIHFLQQTAQRHLIFHEP
ncbi:Uncharacterised protein [uncultured archaeon]|nr:Uncharacterised protein [uncultured archaeon]